MTKKKNILGLIVPLLLGVVLLTYLTACKSSERAEERMEEQTAMTEIGEDALTPILGKGDGSVSGLLDFDQSPEEVQISYYFFIEDIANFDSAIEQDLAPKIQKLYRDIPEIDRVVFTVNVPALEDPPYKPYVSFSVNRKLIEETDWSNLLELEFFEVVQEVKYYD